MEDPNTVADFPALASNAASLPYAVHYRGWRLALRMAGAGCGALVPAFASYQIVRGLENPGKPLLLALCAAVFMFFLFQIWRLTKPQVVLYPDRLEAFGVLQPVVLHRENVKGVGKTVSTRYGSYFEIASKSPNEPSIRLGGALRTDPIVAEWLRGATDPKAEDLKAERANILADPRYGATEAERTRRLERTKQWTTAFNLACLALAAWVGFLAPLSPNVLIAVLAALAVAAVSVQSSNGLVVWFGRPGRPRIVGALAPAVALAAHAGLTVHMLKPGPLGWVAIVVGAAATAQRYAARTTDAARLRSAITLGVLAGLTAYGLGVALDVCLDRSQAKTFVAGVTGKRISHGRSTSYYLDLEPWSDQPASEITVSSSVYETTPVSSQICLIRRAGGLELDWFDVAHCPAAVDAPPGMAAPSEPASGTSRPTWISPPNGDDLAMLYPERAQRLGIEGAATIHCTVQLDTSLTSCRVIYETPQGYGFGAATLRAADRFRMRPATHDGHPVVAGVTIPLAWRLGR